MTAERVHRRRRLTVAAVLAILVLPLEAGVLEPPVPPGNPTMKPIDQVEPRIPIHASDLPLTISEPGSYYLAENISTTGAGIVVTGNFVTIDLMGFILAGGTGPGIDAPSPMGLTVRNGSIVGWDGAGLIARDDAVISDLIVMNNGGTGMRIGPHSRVIRCTANSNGGHGIHVPLGTIVQDSVACYNQENGIWVEYGPSAISNSALVTGSLVDGNMKNGIRVDGNVYVRDNLCRGNGEGLEDKAGIWVNGDANRIENNHLVENDIGLDIDGDHNFIGGNTMRANTTNWRKSASSTGNLFLIYNVASPNPPTRWDNIDW